ncbi:MAG TPA: VCBS repeat-containing protein [Pyrinomonadaceae bacterium]|jgi:hypothetical protein
MRKIISAILAGIFLLANVSLAKAETLHDFDGDGRSDFVVFRTNPNGVNLDWSIYPSGTGVPTGAVFGLVASDTLVPADYDGDGRTDIAVWRPSSEPGQSAFYILNSSNASLRTEVMGQQGDWAFLVAGDYDGDGKADPALYRRYHISAGNRYIYRGSLNNLSGVNTTFHWGAGEYHFPYRGDFDGDGKLDFCIRDNSNATFSLRRSSDGGNELIAFGKVGDEIAPGDYDGDGKTDFCVVREGKSYTLNWYIKERDGGGTGHIPIMWGRTNQDWTFPYAGGDFDGDGKSDLGVYLLFTNEFRIRRSTNATTWSFFWGQFGDNPIHINYSL